MAWFHWHESRSFAVEADVKKDLVLNGINLSRLSNREQLLEQIDNIRQSTETAGIDSFQKKAFGILTSSNMAQALDLEKEDKMVRDWYGDTVTTDPAFGAPPQSAQHLLLARRLVEAGVRCVTVGFRGMGLAQQSRRYNRVSFQTGTFLTLTEQSPYY